MAGGAGARTSRRLSAQRLLCLEKKWHRPREPAQIAEENRITEIPKPCAARRHPAVNRTLQWSPSTNATGAGVTITVPSAALFLVAATCAPQARLRPRPLA